MAAPRPQQDLFAEIAPAIEPPAAAPAKRRSKKTAAAGPLLLGVQAPPLEPRPLGGRRGALLLAAGASLLLALVLEGLNLLWHGGLGFSALLLLTLLAGSGWLLGQKLWREWRAVLSLNALLRRRLVAQQAIAGEPLQDRETFCINLLPPTAWDDEIRLRSEHWLSQHAALADDQMLRRYMAEVIQPWRIGFVSELRQRLAGPELRSHADFTGWLVALERLLLITDEILLGHGIEPAWTVRWRVGRAAMRHLAHFGVGSAAGDGDNLVAYAEALQSILLPGPAGVEPGRGE